MAIELYRKGATKIVNGIQCDSQVWKDTHFDWEALERAGWYRRPEDIPTENPTIPEETYEEVSNDVTPKEPEESDEDQAVRQLAKDEGIKSWHLKSIENLKKELGLDNESESGSSE